ncbi:hypothetical protein F511_28554 [Dorcoceras hygrometricum]|uniref:BHLH domain-containing protein n=1 Tax=Dorcoceras hygrometricum TaxID=472368 RepID=A0A2Z7AXZ2_9LAMI|nr:hypothetical protein F511_28554 [Dorcoceras hygrometricum]
MNCAFPEMLRCLDSAGSISGDNGEMGVFSFPIQSLHGDQSLNELVSGRAMKPDPGVGVDWDLGSEFEMGCVVPRTAGCVQPAEEVTGNIDPVGDFFPGMLCSAAGGGGSKKRKADTIGNFEVDDEQSQEKRMKESVEESSDRKSTKNEPASAMNSKVKTMVPESPKPDYIHVRARRGQATDSHSLAERVRREKISERMKYLQDLVPGCNKIMGKAGLLDEIINYVKSLQGQVEFLSMKLAVINPAQEFYVDNLLPKVMLPAPISDIHTTGVSPEIVNPALVPFNSMAQGVPFRGLETGVNPSDDTVETQLLDSSYLNQFDYSNLGSELQNLYGLEYQQARSASYAPQPFPENPGTIRISLFMQQANKIPAEKISPPEISAEICSSQSPSPSIKIRALPTLGIGVVSPDTLSAPLTCYLWLHTPRRSTFHLPVPEARRPELDLLTLHPEAVSALRLDKIWMLIVHAADLGRSILEQ